MNGIVIRNALLADLPRVTDIYNHYVVGASVTFDLRPLTVGERLPWFHEHAENGPHRLVVSIDDTGRVLGYASTSRFRPKAAYDTTVEASVYCSSDVTRRGIGSQMYHVLFESIADEDVHRIVAGVTLPNPASLALHRRFGFRHVGTFSENGRKFGCFWDVAWFERPLRL